MGGERLGTILMSRSENLRTKTGSHSITAAIITSVPQLPNTLAQFCKLPFS